MNRNHQERKTKGLMKYFKSCSRCIITGEKQFKVTMEYSISTRLGEKRKEKNTGSSQE